MLSKKLFYSILLWILTINLAFANSSIVRLATTTSTENSGLLQVLLPPFEKISGYKVHVVAVGTGKALKMGEQGDADVLMVHSRLDEEKFVAEKFGVNRRDVMYNDFLIVGPVDDPARIKGLSNAVLAFKKIQDKSVTFISRGDKSGTHAKELEIWEAAKMKPQGNWYREAGQGMGEVLQMAGELGAYTLADRGTWLAYKAKSRLQELVAGDEILFNPYGIIAVNPNKYRDINYTGAMSLIAWVTSVPGQTLIRDFKINGESLFTPVAITFSDK